MSSPSTTKHRAIAILTVIVSLSLPIPAYADSLVIIYADGSTETVERPNTIISVQIIRGGEIVDYDPPPLYGNFPRDPCTEHPQFSRSFMCDPESRKILNEMMEKYLYSDEFDIDIESVIEGTYLVTPRADGSRVYPLDEYWDLKGPSSRRAFIAAPIEGTLRAVSYP